MRAAMLAILALGAVGGARASAAVTPSGDHVPENLLRIEVTLDVALSPPLDMRYVNLIDAAGQRVDHAFLELALPDKSERQFTILMHPGRVKRGVGPNLALGPALHEGAYVTLAIDDPRLPAPIRKTWKVGAAQRAAVLPELWTIGVPAANGREPLVATLAAPVNASAAQMIAVATSGGKRVMGTARLEAGETEWRFVPNRRWQPGLYELRVHPSLEDPAGNRLCSAFEERRQSERRCDREATLRFRVSAR